MEWWYSIVFPVGYVTIVGASFALIWRISRLVTDQATRRAVQITGYIGSIVVAFSGIAFLPAGGFNPLGLLFMLFVFGLVAFGVLMVSSVVAVCSWISNYYDRIEREPINGGTGGRAP